MSRVEEFRQARRFRRKLLLALFMFLIMMAIGLCVSDYSVNSLLKNSRRVELVKVDKREGSVYDISLLKKRVSVDTAYMYKDWERLVEQLYRLWPAN